MHVMPIPPSAQEICPPTSSTIRFDIAFSTFVTFLIHYINHPGIYPPRCCCVFASLVAYTYYAAAPSDGPSGGADTQAHGANIPRGI